MIEIKEGIFYDPSKDFENQSDEFKEYFNNLYSEQATEQVVNFGYPDFENDGSIIFLVNDTLFRAEVIRVQVRPNSASYRAIKETIIEIFIK